MKNGDAFIAGWLFAWLAAAVLLGLGGVFEAGENAHRAWCAREDAMYMAARGEDGTTTYWCVPTDSARKPWRVP